MLGGFTVSIFIYFIDLVYMFNFATPPRASHFQTNLWIFNHELSTVLISERGFDSESTID